VIRPAPDDGLKPSATAGRLPWVMRSASSFGLATRQQVTCPAPRTPNSFMRCARATAGSDQRSRPHGYEHCDYNHSAGHRQAPPKGHRVKGPGPVCQSPERRASRSRRAGTQILQALRTIPPPRPHATGLSVWLATTARTSRSLHLGAMRADSYLPPLLRHQMRYDSIDPQDCKDQPSEARPPQRRRTRHQLLNPHGPLLHADDIRSWRQIRVDLRHSSIHTATRETNCVFACSRPATRQPAVSCGIAGNTPEGAYALISLKCDGLHADPLTDGIVRRLAVDTVPGRALVAWR
jgi:hypothetical protein